MGAFFSNIQVYIDSNHLIQSREQLVTILKNELEKQGYEETDLQTENTRTLAISNINNGWISLYDEHIEENHSEEPMLFLTKLSKSITNPLVLISVFDSDIIDLRLLRNGKLIDTLNNQSRIFSNNILSKVKKNLGNRYKPWSILNLDKVDLKRLNDVWNNNYVFVEELLEKTAEIINWNKDYCSVGYNYLNDSNLDDLLFLRFKKKESEKILKQNLEPTTFEFLSYYSFIEGSVNEVKEYHFMLTNVGMESEGFSVGIYGEAVENKYIAVDRILASNSLETLKNGEIINTYTTKKDELILGKFDSVVIPKGCDTSSMAWSKVIEKRFSSAIHVKLYLKFQKDCKSTINFVFIPNSNQSNGQVSFSIPVKITD